MVLELSQSTPFSRRSPLRSSHFLRPIHPKTEIRPSAASIQKVLDAGWYGQLKIHGHRSQIHISANPDEEILAYNRQGQLHKKEIPDALIAELRRVFSPKTQWNVIDGEWVKADDKIYVFDFLKQDGVLLNRLNFISRWKLLPRAYISPAIQTLGVFTTLDQCMEALQRPEEFIEGLVFKSNSPGFEDSSIIRCRRQVL